MKATRICTWDGCNSAYYCQGLCRYHYDYARRHGLIETHDRRQMAPLERFWEFAIVTPGGCWWWTGVRNTEGYGRFRLHGGQVASHRFAYEQFVGPIPDGLHLDHLCRNRACCNPLHLQPVTPAVNILRGIGAAALNSRKTHCNKGHELSGDNLFVRGNQRICRRCRNDQAIAYMKRRRAEARSERESDAAGRLPGTLAS